MPKSIFDQVTTFKPLTADRRLMLRVELIAIASAVPVLVALWALSRCMDPAIVAIFQFFAMLLSPVGPGLKITVLTIINCIVALFTWMLSPLQTESGKALALVVITGLGTLGLAVGLFNLLVHHTNGLFGQIRNRSVLFEELRRWWYKNREPRLKLSLFPVSYASLVTASVVAIVVPAFFTFALGSGILADLFPSGIFQALKMAAWQSLVSLLYAGMRFDQVQHLIQSTSQPCMAAIIALVTFGPASLIYGSTRAITQRLVITPTFIEFPSEFDFCLRFRRKRRWLDIESVEFGDKDCVHFKFRSGGVAEIPAAAFSQQDFQLLIQGIEELCLDCKIDSKLEQIATLNALETAMPTSFTHVWNEGLTTQYKSTIFVPTEPGASLNGGSIRIIRQLASTPWSATFLARTHEHKLVVVKELMLPESERANSKAKQLFDRECATLMALDHPGIARVYDHFHEEGRDYLVLAYTPGRDLQQTVRSHGPMDENVVRNIALQICDVLEYLHERDVPIVHRDISPDNIVLDNDGRVHLIDFGAAKHVVQNATGTLIGKQSFISPEQLRGKATPQSDLYALGATIYSLLTGKQPTALRQCKPNSDEPRCSEVMDKLVRDLTEFEQEARPTSAAGVRDRLKEMLGQSEPSKGFTLHVGKTEKQNA